jgi:hypothetical protein
MNIDHSKDLHKVIKIGESNTLGVGLWIVEPTPVLSVLVHFLLLNNEAGGAPRIC